MLETNPDWRGKVTLIMLVVPSRIGIADYEGMKKRIEELVGKITVDSALSAGHPSYINTDRYPFSPWSRCMP